MPIKLITGSIFDSECQTLVNPVNCVGVMGAGLAKEFKYRYDKTDLFWDYKHRCARGEVRLGFPYLFTEFRNTNGKWKPVVLFPTKDHWRSRSYLAPIEHGLQYLADHIDAWHIESIAFPALGCGKGGLSWSVVLPTMIDLLNDLEIPVEIYRPQEES